MIRPIPQSDPLDAPTPPAREPRKAPTPPPPPRPIGRKHEPITEAKKKEHSDAWKRCVEKVGSRGGGNAYAICTASMGGASFKDH